MNTCECGSSLFGDAACHRTDSVTVGLSFCITRNNVSQRAVLHRCTCPLSGKIKCYQYGLLAAIKIPTNISGAELNDITCKIYNRQGTHCEHCKNGIGPVPFSDGFNCAD